MRCVYCGFDKDSFTKEHVVPVSFGGTSRHLQDLVCSDCNSRFSRDFEGKFLKGKGIESFLRAAEGKKGRHDYPVFGDGSYGNKLFITISDRYPPIQARVSREGLVAPIQMISVSGTGKLFHSVQEPGRFQGTSAEFLDGLWSRNPDNADTTSVFLWVRDTDISVNNYRFLRQQFYRFLGEI